MSTAPTIGELLLFARASGDDELAEFLRDDQNALAEITSDEPATHSAGPVIADDEMQWLSAHGFACGHCGTDDDHISMSEDEYLDMLAAEAEEDVEKFGAAKAKPQKVMKTITVHRKGGKTIQQKRLVNVEVAKKAKPAKKVEPAPKAKSTPAKADAPKPAKSATKRTKEKKSDKALRAKKAHVMVDKTIQRYAEEYSEPRMGKLLGGGALPDSEPCDLKLPADPKSADEWVKATDDYRAAMKKWDADGRKGARPMMAKLKGDVGGLVELKTMVVGENDKLTMDKYAQVRKVVTEKETGAPYHTVAIDDRGVINLETGEPGDESKRIYYYRRGIAGSARIGTMHKCESEDELKALMAMPEDELPEGAQRTDDHMREGTWKYFEDAAGKGYKNSKTGEIARPKK